MIHSTAVFDSLPRPVCPSVHPSITLRYCVETAEPVVKILSATDSQIILAFSELMSLHNSDKITCNESLKPIWV